MDWHQAMTLVNEVATTSGALATTALKVRDFVSGTPTNALPPASAHVVAALPQGTSAEQVVQTLAKELGFGGALHVKAGDNLGGSIYARDVDWAAGDGVRGGGDAVVRAGDGGPHGSGGDVTIVGGTIRAGNAK